MAIIEKIAKQKGGFMLSKKVVFLALVVLVSLSLTGCIGMGVSRSQQVNEVKQLVADLQDEELTLVTLTDWPISDTAGVLSQLETALGYFADEFKVSYTVDYLVREIPVVQPADSGLRLNFSRKLNSEKLLGYDPLVDTDGLDDYWESVLDDVEQQAFYAFMLFVDQDLDQILEESYFGFALRPHGMDDSLIEDIRIGDFDFDEVVEEVRAGFVRLIHIYSRSIDVDFVDGQTETGENSIIMSMEFTKDSSWKFSGIELAEVLDITFPEGDSLWFGR